MRYGGLAIALAAQGRVDIEVVDKGGVVIGIDGVPEIAQRLCLFSRHLARHDAEQTVTRGGDPLWQVLQQGGLGLAASGGEIIAMVAGQILCVVLEGAVVEDGIIGSAHGEQTNEGGWHLGYHS
nr:hypothetical protein [Aeromonas salmonicida]